MAAVSPTQVWAVGHYVTTLLSTVGLIEQWDGSAWRVISHPSAGPDSTSEHLNAVAGTTPQDVWAVGDYVYRGARQRTLIEHWNGSSWSIIATPNPGSSWNELNAVAAVSAHDAWAVGNSASEGAPLHTLIEHWNGTRWQRVPTPEVPAQSAYLLGITAISPHNVWAIGSRENTGSQQALIEHWDGTHWTIFPQASASTSSDTLRAAARIPGTTAVWAVGLASNSSFSEFYC